MPAAPAAPTYHCTNTECGALWSADQVIHERFGQREVLLCPNCRLGVEELIAQPSFGARVPSAFEYPFAGDGRWMMIAGTVFLTFLDFASGFGFLIGLIAAVFIYGYFGSLLLDVVRTTATNESRPLEWPELTGLDEMVGNALQIIASVAVVFAPALICGLMGLTHLTAEAGSDSGTWLALLGLIFGLGGLLYYPMAFLALAMFDSVGAALNPFLVIPAISRARTPYALVLLLLVGLYLVRVIVGTVSGAMVWWLKLLLIFPTEFVVLYTMVVSARLLGLLYRSNEQNLGWFR